MDDGVVDRDGDAYATLATLASLASLASCLSSAFREHCMHCMYSLEGGRADESSWTHESSGLVAQWPKVPRSQGSISSAERRCRQTIASARLNLLGCFGLRGVGVRANGVAGIMVAALDLELRFSRPCLSAGKEQTRITNQESRITNLGNVSFTTCG